MNNALFAGFEEAECDMDIEVELLAIENKEKKQKAKNEKNILETEQKSLMTSEDYQQSTESNPKNTLKTPVPHPDS
jgi:hypothetical protein